MSAFRYAWNVEIQVCIHVWNARVREHELDEMCCHVRYILISLTAESSSREAGTVYLRVLWVRDNQNTQRVNGFCFVCCLFFSSEMLFMCTLLSMRSYQNTQRVNCCCWMLFFSSEHLSCNGNCFFCGWCIDVYQTIWGGGGGEMGGGERPGGGGGVRGYEIVEVLCTLVWMQGSRRDRVRYVTHYSIRLCFVVMFHV